MALPKLKTLTYELSLPSTGKTIKYRPFLVKEQKNLMIAQESEDEKLMETIVSIKPLLAVLVSSIGAIFILSARKNPNLRESWSIIAGVLKLFIVLSMIPELV